MRREAEVWTEGLAVREVNDRAGFMALEPEWNELVSRCDDQIFYRHEFFRVWIDHFAPSARLRVITLRDSTGRLCAALPMVQERARFYGLPICELHAAANAHSCRFDLIALEPERAATAIVEHLLKDPSWDVIRLTDVPEGGRAFALLDEARRRQLPNGTWESLRSPYVPLPETFEALMARLDGKFKANLRRRRRKLEEKGKVTFDQVRGGSGLEAALADGLRLEQSGWKGKEGTAIAQDRATRGFYSELAQVASAKDALALSFLRLDGKPIAFHYALEHRGTYLLLKPGYDETLKECSPGQLMMEEAFRACCERRFGELDFLGPDMVWKRDWSDRVRVHTWIYVFRPSALGRALRDAKFEWAPKMKEALARWKR